ncbi:hypothetical protein [Leifsonia sp. NPDC080035]|uniref:Secreted protein n=1 Tax=Leifsonia sp. NPDC080035 TaxID=3143936 RepID=A0AAU7G9I6_9MICO
MRSGFGGGRRVLAAVGGIAVLAAVLFFVSGAWVPWWDGITMGGIDRTVMNDTTHTITWHCGTGDRPMRPGETETLHFATQSLDESACSRADDIELCVDTNGPERGRAVPASDAVREWACT